VNPPLPVAVLGATGRMGTAILESLADDPGFILSGALAASEDGSVSVAGAKSAPVSIPLTSSPDRAVAGASVAVDFTLPEALPGNLAACRRAACAAVVGVTGLGPRELDALADAARDIPVFYAANMSVGVGMLAALARAAGALLPAGWEAGLLDVHHSAKRDAPSGTALALEAAFRAGRSDDGHPVAHAALRVGDVVGEHTVWLSGPGERLELTHRALDRRIFARGALRAAAWLAGRPPGMYGMGDLLGSGMDTFPS
jgi:4-hydroxy-tetrahydrodipicolinate reductase